jgi:hypothetical protein
LSLDLELHSYFESLDELLLSICELIELLLRMNLMKLNITLKILAQLRYYDKQYKEQLNDLRKPIDELTKEFYKFKMKPVLKDILVFAQFKEVDQ